MRAQRFEDLTVWQAARVLVREVYRASGTERFSRDRGLQSQIRRAAVSVMSNVAEGFGRYTRPEFRRYLVIARGEAAEVQSQLYVALDLDYINTIEHHQLNSLCESVAKQLSALRTSLDTAPNLRMRLQLPSTNTPGTNTPGTNTPKDPSA